MCKHSSANLTSSRDYCRWVPAKFHQAADFEADKPLLISSCRKPCVVYGWLNPRNSNTKYQSDHDIKEWHLPVSTSRMSLFLWCGRISVAVINHNCNVQFQFWTNSLVRTLVFERDGHQTVYSSKNIDPQKVDAFRFEVPKCTSLPHHGSRTFRANDLYIRLAGK